MQAWENVENAITVGSTSRCKRNPYCYKSSATSSVTRRFVLFVLLTRNSIYNLRCAIQFYSLKIPISASMLVSIRSTDRFDTDTLTFLCKYESTYTLCKKIVGIFSLIYIYIYTIFQAVAFNKVLLCCLLNRSRCIIYRYAIFCTNTLSDIELIPHSSNNTVYLC